MHDCWHLKILKCHAANKEKKGLLSGILTSIFMEVSKRGKSPDS